MLGNLIPTSLISSAYPPEPKYNEVPVIDTEVAVCAVVQSSALAVGL